MLLPSPQSRDLELGTREISLVLKMGGHQKLWGGGRGTLPTPTPFTSSCKYETLRPPKTDGRLQAHGAPFPRAGSSSPWL